MSPYMARGWETVMKGRGHFNHMIKRKVGLTDGKAGEAGEIKGLLVLALKMEKGAVCQDTGEL